MDYFEHVSEVTDSSEFWKTYEQATALPYEELAFRRRETGEYLAYEAMEEVAYEAAEAVAYEAGEEAARPVASAAHRPAPHRPPTFSSGLGRPLRIVCLGPSFELGGVGQQTLSLAKEFDPARARITRCLVTRGDGEGHRRLRRLGIPVERATTERMKQAASEADLFLLWGDHFDQALPRRRPVCVFVAHGESAWTRQGLERSRSVVDHVIAVSERVRKRVCAGFPTTTILNGIDTSRLAATRPRQAVRRALGIRSDEFVLGCVGRMTREKQMERLVDAVALLPRSFKLLLVGHGTRRLDLLERANDLLPGRFVMLTRDQHLGDLYRAMDAFGLPSAHEGFGLVVAEAMACRRPVIATSVGAVPEIIENNVSGLIVDGTPRSFADAAVRLRQWPQWAAGMAREADAFALRHLNARRMAADYENLLTRLVLDRAARS